MKILTYVSREEARKARKNMSTILTEIRFYFPRFKRYEEKDIMRFDDIESIS
jgi:hypothetical protein